MGNKIVLNAGHGGGEPCATYMNRKEMQMNEIPTDEAQMNETPVYKVQVGVFKVRANSDKLLYRIQEQGFPAFIVSEDGYYRVQVGVFTQLDKAAAMELNLRKQGYSTYIVTF